MTGYEMISCIFHSVHQQRYTTFFKVSCQCAICHYQENKHKHYTPPHLRSTQKITTSGSNLIEIIYNQMSTVILVTSDEVSVVPWLVR